MQVLVLSSGRKAGAAALALTASLFIFAGCNNAETPPSPAPPTGAGKMSAPSGGGKMAAGGGTGQELLAANCRCHNGGKAPDLSHIGADKSKTAGWIAEYAADPKSKDPNSKMPPQKNVSSEEMTKIATYLASQK